MKDAWAELKHFANVSLGSLVTMTFTVWLCAMRNRLLRKYPHFQSNPNRGLASTTREVTDALRDPAIRAEAGITQTTLRELERVAALYEQKAKNFDVLQTIAPPAKKARARNADQIAFVYQLCVWLGRESERRRPYALVAILANVVFDVSPNKQWDADRVKHCLRARSRRK